MNDTPRVEQDMAYTTITSRCGKSSVKYNYHPQGWYFANLTGIAVQNIEIFTGGKTQNLSPSMCLQPPWSFGPPLRPSGLPRSATKGLAEQRAPDPHSRTWPVSTVIGLIGQYLWILSEFNIMPYYPEFTDQETKAQKDTVTYKRS